MQYNIAICDDEKMTLKINAKYISDLAKNYKVEANIMCFSSGVNLVEYGTNHCIDAVFLDIDMTEMNGLEVAAQLMKNNPRLVVVFITGHREFAYEAFSVEALGYLTKPVEYNKLDRSFKKVICQIQDNYLRSNRKTLIITEDSQKKRLRQNIIIYIEKVGAQSIIVTKQEKYAVYESISSLMDRLESCFIRINQGVIVNLEHVSGIEKGYVVMFSGTKFSIGRTYNKEVKEAFLNYP